MNYSDPLIVVQWDSLDFHRGNEIVPRPNNHDVEITKNIIEFDLSKVSISVMDFFIRPLGGRLFLMIEPVFYLRFLLHLP